MKRFECCRLTGEVLSRHLNTSTSQHPNISTLKNVDLWYNRSMKLRYRKGQTMVEYVLCVIALLVVGSAMWYLVGATKRSVHRTENLISSDYP